MKMSMIVRAVRKEKPDPSLTLNARTSAVKYERERLAPSGRGKMPGCLARFPARLPAPNKPGGRLYLVLFPRMPRFRNQHL